MQHASVLDNSGLKQGVVVHKGGLSKWGYCSRQHSGGVKGFMYFHYISSTIVRIGY